MTRMSTTSLIRNWNPGGMTILVSSMALSTWGLMGCAPNEGSTAAQDVAALSGVCAGSQKLISPESLKLQGPESADSGQVVTLKLSEDLGCASATSVTWSTMGGKVLAQENSTLATQFDEAGRFLVSAKVESSLGATLLTQSTVVVDNAPSLEGPQVALPGMELNFTVVTPSDMKVANIRWSTDDGAAGAGATFALAFEAFGEHQVRVSVTTESGAVYELSQTVTVIEYYDDFGCLPESQIFAPREGITGQPVDFAVSLPPCVRDFVSAVRWNFGDASPQTPGLSAAHTYAHAGTFEVSADVYSPLAGDQMLFRLRHRIKINEPTSQPPAPKCRTLGEIRTEILNLRTEKRACGLDGIREEKAQTKVTFECRFVDPVQDWVEVSRVDEVTDAGFCQGQSCRLADQSVLKDGESHEFFRETRPAGLCADGRAQRRCVNGVLDGSEQFSQLTCEDGCPGFGPSQTLKPGIVIGEVRHPVTCAFSEPGIEDIWARIEDRVCVAGVVRSQNARDGELLQKGKCPIYDWAATDRWSACSADCGGRSEREYECRDDQGRAADSSRCLQPRPQDEKACDANPGAVARQEESREAEEAVSSNKCPKNQIGIILKSREVITTKNFACVDHRVQLTGEEKTTTPWMEERYCRDYVAHRCSHDSLSNTQAKGRYEWMKKCRDQVPVIDEFLTNFDDVHAGSSGIDSSSRVLYPTFMNAAVKPEKTWIAPTSTKSSCEVPAKVYVAAVCVSSCATPEQKIWTDLKSKDGMTFIEALTAQTASVVTVRADSRRGHLKFERSAVTQWVTELVETDHEILVFRTKSGGELRVTPNHPLVDGEGRVREARTFIVGDQLIRANGESDPIVSLASSTYHGKVYNVFTASADLHRNLVVTGGFVNGTAYYQNEGASQMNREVLRARLIKGVFGRGEP